MAQVRWFSIERSLNDPGFELQILKSTGELQRFWINSATLNLIAVRIRAASPQWSRDDRHESPKQGVRPAEIDERNVVVSANVEAYEDALRLSLESERGTDRFEWTSTQALALLQSIEVALAAAGTTG